MGFQTGKFMDQITTGTPNTRKTLNRWEFILYACVLFLYVCINIFLMLNHEVWRDESQAWLLAKQLSWTQIPGLCASEGHPVLWFYLLKITIMLGLPFRYFGIISIFFMTLAAGLFLFRSGFKWFSKILVILSPVFFYYNPIICRNYSVVVFLVCALCSFWNDRHEKPLLYAGVAALLFQSHVLIFGLPIGCVLDMCIDLIRNREHRKIRHFSGLFLSVSSFALMILELKQDPGSKNFINITPDFIMNRLRDGSWVTRLIGVTVPFDHNGISIGSVVLFVAFIVILAFLFMSLDESFRKQHLSDLLVYSCGIGVYLGIVLFVRDMAHIQMAIVFCVLILFFCWILRDSKKGIILEIMLLVMCVPLIPKTLVIDAYGDIKESYSGSKEISELIDRNVENGSVILINNHFLSTSVISYLSDSPKNYVFWDVDNGCEFRMHKWGETNAVYIDERNISEHVSDTAKKSSISGKVYYVKCNEYLPVIQNGNVLVSGFFNSKTRFYIPEIEENRYLELIDKNKTENLCSEYYLLYKVRA